MDTNREPLTRVRTRRPGQATAFLLLLVLLALDVPDPTPGIFLDGRFRDWENVPLLLSDPLDAPEKSPVDILDVHATDDPAWLYLSVELAGAVNMQAMPGTLHLVVDADDDATTGGTAFGLPGADFVLDLSHRAPPGDSGYGAGFALRPVDERGMGPPRSAYDLRAAGLPTWASERFELRISRGGAEDGFARFGASLRLKLVFAGDDTEGDETEVARYTFGTPRGPTPFVPTLEPLRNRVTGSLRVAQWNVSGASFRNPAQHARVLAALAPDVLLLDEVYRDISDAALAAFFAHPDLARLGSWKWVFSETGGRQRTVVAARDRDVRAEPSMTGVRYDPADLAALREDVPAMMHRALDLEAESDLSATGAWVAWDGTEVLFVPLDLQSAGYLGSPQDLLRNVQSRTLARHIAEVLSQSGTRRPVVVGGDFNVVGSDEPLRILSRGFDVDGTDLAIAEPRRLGEASLFTWHDPNRGPFAPGRLDLTLYADAALEEVGGFVFSTGDLTDGQLAQLGLERHLSDLTSDHLVVVTDLRLR